MDKLEQLIDSLSSIADAIGREVIVGVNKQFLQDTSVLEELAAALRLEAAKAKEELDRALKRVAETEIINIQSQLERNLKASGVSYEAALEKIHNGKADKLIEYTGHRNKDIDSISRQVAGFISYLKTLSEAELVSMLSGPKEELKERIINGDWQGYF